MNIIRLATILALSLSLTACFFGGREKKCSKPQEYQASRSVKGIEVPEDLDKPDRRTPLNIPPPASGETEKPPADVPCLEEPPSYSG